MSSDSPLLQLTLDEANLSSLKHFRKRLRLLPTLPKITASKEAVHTARLHWEERARSEYIGTLNLYHLHGLLVDMNAPMDLQEISLQMIHEEQQHVRLCMNAAHHLGSNGQLNFNILEIAPRRTDVPLNEQFLENLIGMFSIGEVVALKLLNHSIKELRPSSYREILVDILRDEVFHARFGGDLLAHLNESKPDWCPLPSNDWIENTKQQFIQYMKSREVVDPEEVRIFESQKLATDLNQLGVPCPVSFKRKYFSILESLT